MQHTDISNLHITDLSEPLGTCLRMLGNGNFHPAGTFSLTEQYQFGVGVAVVTQDANFAGAVPDPLIDVLQDWYYWHAWNGLLSEATPNYQWSFDIRTARKLREGYRLVWVSQVFAEEIGSELKVNLRTLWTLS